MTKQKHQFKVGDLKVGDRVRNKNSTEVDVLNGMLKQVFRGTVTKVFDERPRGEVQVLWDHDPTHRDVLIDDLEYDV